VALVDDRGAQVAERFDRQPPQDITAEQSVLGGMLLSKDAIADVVEVLRPGDFYRPAHQAVYDCVLDLYSRGEPADPITVSAELERRGDLGRVGGAPYLHTLIATVPTAANAGYYAEIVAEKAVLRRLVEAGTKIVQLGYHGAEGADVDSVVDRAQTAVYDVTERRMSDDYIALEELLQPTMDEIDAIASHGGAASGVPTGFADLDAVTNGLHPGQMVVVAARPGLGKALALDTALPTPDGWTTMGAVAVGDRLFDAAGLPTTVVAVTEVLTGRRCFEIEFSDGAVIVADAQHRWLTDTRSPLTGTTVRTTEEIAATAELDHSVPAGAALRLPARELPVPPYSFGVRLAGGTEEAAIAMRIDAEEQELGVAAPSRPDRIPPEYQRASEAQRRALLAGLLDADAAVLGSGRIRLTLPHVRLADDVRELVAGLGYRCDASTGCEVSFSTDHDVFRLERKKLAHKALAHSPASAAAHRIVDVRPVPSVPVRCVQVAGADHLYLAGRSMIPTHNSTLGLDWVRSCSVTHGMTSVIFSLEMSRTEIVMRLLSAEARIRLSDMRSGRMGDDDWTRLARRMGEISEAPLFIDDSPNMTMMEIRAKARRLKQRNDLKLIVLDYLQLMTSGKRVESRQQEVSEFSRQLKLLAKELEVPLVAISQLNRGPEQRTDKKPMLADLRESGCLTAGTRVLRADTGAEVTLGELLRSGARDVPVWSLDDRLRLVARPMTHAFPSGTKEVFRLTLASGREVQATANHPFRTVHGWCALGDLGPGDRVAAPRRIPPPLTPTPMPEERVVLLARLIGAGSFDRGQEKSVPPAVCSLPDEQLALFLRQLWATNGSVSWDSRLGGIHWGSTSRRLVQDVSRLLLRFGVRTRLVPARRRGHRDRWQLRIHGLENQSTFLRGLGVPGNSGIVGHEVCNGAPSRSRPAGMAAVLDDGDPEVLATNDVCWDEIVAVESLGEQMVYDATVPGTHNFIADGIAVHNSIEQDADMVVLLHRPDAFERDDPRAGEADLILAKHRNGPTSTITVAHQLHYSRFVDMARG